MENETEIFFRYFSFFQNWLFFLFDCILIISISFALFFFHSDSLARPLWESPVADGHEDDLPGHFPVQPFLPRPGNHPDPRLAQPGVPHPRLNRGPTGPWPFWCSDHSWNCKSRDTHLPQKYFLLYNHHERNETKKNSARQIRICIKTIWTIMSKKWTEESQRASNSKHVFQFSWDEPGHWRA